MSLLGAALFLAGSAVLLLALGTPQERDAISAWLLFGLLCFSLSDMRGFARGVVRDWLPFLALLVAYDSVRVRPRTYSPSTIYRSCASIRRCSEGARRRSPCSTRCGTVIPSGTTSFFGVST